MKTIVLLFLIALSVFSGRIPVQAQPTPTPPASQLGNISTRCLVQTADSVMIGGFIIQGPEPKKVIIRAIGPSLAQHGVTNPLGNPTLTLHNTTGSVIGANDDWQTTQIGGVITADQVSDLQNSQLAPSQANESAIIAILQPGAYTAIVRGANGGTGVGLVEVYDVAPNSLSTLGNISTRCLIQTGESVMIGGFIIQGLEPKKVMVRAIGPSLAGYGIVNPLSDPILTLHDANGVVIGVNDNWATTQIGGVITGAQGIDIQNSQLAPSHANESAIVATLPPGAYTAVVGGVNTTTGVGLVEVYGLAADEGVSLGDITLAGVSETTFNSTGSTVKFRITGETFSTNPGDIHVYRNQAFVGENLTHIGETEISVDPILTEGRNDIILVATDSHGQLVYREFALWAGSNTLQGNLLDENNQPVTGATLSLRLGDDQNVVSTTVSTNGTFGFTNLPGRTVFLNAVASQNRLASIAINGSEGSVQLKLNVIDDPSPIDNNDFSMGTDGWNIGTAPVQIVPHQEGPIATGGLSFIHGGQPSATAGVPMDLVLNTQGEGPQMIARTFLPRPGTRNVTVRYRFVTSEVPGGYFGTQYNDYFNVSIRSELGGGAISESQSMNGLGLAAFNVSGATEWREASLPLNADGDVVQVNLIVANVADGAYDSQLVVDFVEEKQISITRLILNDIDASPLKYLSADSANPYFGGKTRVHGQVTVQGPSDDELQSLVLEIIQGGVVVATADLAQSARGSLLKPFGPSGKVEITSTQLLFELASDQAGNVDGTEDGTLSLRARATSGHGQKDTKDTAPVQLLVRYTDSNRYGQRDNELGGDDWVRPSLRDITLHFSEIDWGDFSNMNGGPFAPHSSHRAGIDVDGYFGGYEARNAATAAQIIQHLNDNTYGSEISLVFVTFQQTASNAFWNAIKDVVLDDGRAAKTVILPVKGHTTHFHWRK